MAAQGFQHSPSSAPSNFRDLARVLADNFTANSALKDNPHSQVIVVLGSSASDIPPLLSWSNVELKEKILDRVGLIFQDQDIFLKEICRVFSSEFGHYLWKNHSKEERRKAILRDARVEQISSVACQMLGHADFMVRELLSEEYKAKGGTDEGPPPHLTYELLAHLVMHGFINHIVTMNFDEMLDTALENELGQKGFTRIITGHEPLGSSEANMPKLLKVHGTASSPESLRFTYTEVSVLTSAQVKHFNALLDSAGTADCECLNLISFGYSWQDPDLAHWVLANLERFKTIFIVRQKGVLPEIFAKRLDDLPGIADRFQVLSVNDLCTGLDTPLPSSLFWWCLMDKVWGLLRKSPLIPFSRHLLLGNLVSANNPGWYTPLARRVQMEILLHLLKSKGMINTFGAPDSPRIRAYFSRLRKAHKNTVTVDDFLNHSGLRQFMQRSPAPEARDTFFSTAESIDKLVEDVSQALAQDSPPTIKRPILLDNGLLTIEEVSTLDFVRKQAKRIVNAPEIEISKEPNIKLYWVFSHPVPILSFPQFATTVRDVLAYPWTHLLIIVESKRWLNYPWTREVLKSSRSRSILMILPSLEGLNGWEVGFKLREAEQTISMNDTLLEIEVPWWKHNRHIFLPVRVDDEVAELGPGVFFLREHKSPVVAPVLLKEPRDRAKLLATFILYSQRSRTPNEGRLREELRHLGEQLLEKGGIDPDMQELVRKALAAISIPG